MKTMSLYSPGVIRYGCLHFAPDRLSNPDIIKHHILQDLKDSNFDIAELKKHKIILDFCGEGQCDQDIIHFVEIMKDLCKDVLVLFSSVVDTGRLPYLALSLPESMANHQSWFEIIDRVPYSSTVENKFICLMRRPSASRARIASTLVNIPSVIMSFGSMCQPYELDEYKSHFPHIELPITIDGIISDDRNHQQHDQRHKIFRNNCFNLVVESSSQTDPGIWTSTFITEKTYKAFGLRQIPIWFAVPGLVKSVKKLGFDIFDDLVDHGYDDINDESTRHQQVIEQVKKLDSTYDLNKCQNLRESLRSRLDANYNKILELQKLYHDRTQSILDQFQFA